MWIFAGINKLTIQIIPAFDYVYRDRYAFFKEIFKKINNVIPEKAHLYC